MGAFWVANWISFILGMLLGLHWVAEALDQLKAQYDGSALGDHSKENGHRVYFDLDQQNLVCYDT